MDAVAEAELVAGGGVRGSADQGGKRQITIVDEAAWRAATAEAGGHIDPSKRRGNVLLRGVDLRNSRGRMLRLGECTVRIHGETRPCERMDEALPGLREALKSDWRGGVYGEIVDGGTIRVGDTAEWIEETAQMS
jgi:MOSC domain-containing protein YiiM